MWASVRRTRTISQPYLFQIPFFETSEQHIRSLYLSRDFCAKINGTNSVYSLLKSDYSPENIFNLPLQIQIQRRMNICIQMNAYSLKFNGSSTNIYTTYLYHALNYLSPSDNKLNSLNVHTAPYSNPAHIHFHQPDKFLNTK